MDDIDALISSHCEENIHLDFKAAGAIDRTKTDEISKDISAFANSDGGVIIYGLSEKDHVACEKSYIDGNVYTKEWLEQIISSKIHRPIEGITIFPLRENNDISKSIYVVRIPRSNMTPHMAADHRYYKRQNFKNVLLEEYEVRDLFGRKANSSLKIDGCGLHFVNDTNSIGFCAYVINISNVVEPVYKINVYLTGSLIDNFKDMVLSWQPFEERLHKTILFKKIKLTAVGDNPLFPNESMDMCRFEIKSPNGFSEELLRESRIEIILYNQFGEQDKFTTTMYDALLH